VFRTTAVSTASFTFAIVDLFIILLTYLLAKYVS